MNLSDYRKQQMQDPEFRAYAEQMQPFAEQPAYENAEAQLGVCEEKARPGGSPKE